MRLLPLLLVGCALTGGRADWSDAVERCDGTPSDPFDLTDAASIEGDTLLLPVGYSGGCADHAFRACWDGSFAESDPVQATLTIQHDANGDSCEAYLSETLAFDLSPLAEAHREAYPGSDVVVDLGVAGESLRYAP